MRNIEETNNLFDTKINLIIKNNMYLYRNILTDLVRT